MNRMKAVGIILLGTLLWATAALGWSFGVCGDSRDDKHGIFPRILRAVEASDMEFLLHTGDLERPGGTKSWETFKAKTEILTKPLHVTIGNHELHGGTREEFTRFFGLPSPSYAFSHKNARFLILDNAEGSLPDSLLAWLDGELATHPKGKDGVVYIVVAMHVPPQTDSIFPHRTKSGYGVQSIKFLNVLLRHKVDLILCSHEHMHHVEDWSGIKIIVSGGAGSPIVPFQKYGYYRIDLADGEVRETFLPVKPTK